MLQRLGTAARSLLYGLEGYYPLVVSLSVVLLMLAHQSRARPPLQQQSWRSRDGVPP